MPFTTLQKLQILQELMKGLKAKELAFRYDCQPSDIYTLRDQYLKQKWVMKRHPKKEFKLEE